MKKDQLKEEVKKTVRRVKWHNSIEIKKKIYSKVIKELVKQRYTISSQNKYQTVLHAPKKFNWAAFIALTLIFNIFGLVGYLIFYSVKEKGRLVVLIKKS